jgi:hypothetical protein
LKGGEGGELLEVFRYEKYRYAGYGHRPREPKGAVAIDHGFDMSIQLLLASPTPFALHGAGFMLDPPLLWAVDAR